MRIECGLRLVLSRLSSSSSSPSSRIAVIGRRFVAVREANQHVSEVVDTPHSRRTDDDRRLALLDQRWALDVVVRNQLVAVEHGAVDVIVELRKIGPALRFE